MSEYTLWALSGISKRLEPFVQLRWGDKESIAQMTPAEARNYASQIMEAAEAAETDAFIVRFLLEKLDLPMEQVAPVLLDFRRFRESYGGQRMPTEEDFKGQEFDEEKKKAKESLGDSKAR